MRESNFAFPAQNKACVCITSQLYDRRALDTTSALPLFNSLTHLTYLTSTSLRIREIMTMDGGLERLVRMLHDFCICPPPPDNPAVFYGLSPPNARPQKPIPTLNPTSFDKHAAYRFSLAFQCVVNIGVRGSESIRSRVVDAGTLEVVGCILEAWLANKGFAVGPSSSASGMPRETREQRHARRQLQAEQRQREEAAELARALHRQIQVETAQRLNDIENSSVASRFSLDSDAMNVSPIPGSSNGRPLSLGYDDGPASASTNASNSDTDVDTSTDASATGTPLPSGTPTGTVVVPGRERSGTIIGRPIWDDPPPQSPSITVTRHRSHRAHRAPPSPSPDTSRPDTETEDDGDVDMDHVVDRSLSLPVTDEEPTTSASPSPERHARHHHHGSLGRRAVGIVSDTPAEGRTDLQDMAHIIINDAQGVVGDGGLGVEDGIVSLEPNDDFAMGAPPGAPGAIDEAAPQRAMEPRRRDAPSDATPRAGVVNLPALGHNPMGRTPGHLSRTGTLRGRDGNHTMAAGAATAAATAATASARNHHHHHHRDSDSGPYRDEDVLLSLQLLAYLSKYPHVRQAFYKPRATFHPASVNLPSVRAGPNAALASNSTASASSSTLREKVSSVKEGGFFKAFTGSRGKEKEKQAPVPVNAAASSSTPPRHTNVFSLVERFTFRPSSTETDMPNPPPKLPQEIQYWAGVIMRNACRKDESRGGIRQCANMLCGRWEEYPRQFAKCRRCRKAKYCGKECQSTAWSEGHRFWCSAKDGDDDPAADPPPHNQPSSPHHHHNAQQNQMAQLIEQATTLLPGLGVSRPGRERERHGRERTMGTFGFDATVGSGRSRPTTAEAPERADEPSLVRSESASRRQPLGGIPMRRGGGISELAALFENDGDGRRRDTLTLGQRAAEPLLGPAPPSRHRPQPPPNSAPLERFATTRARTTTSNGNFPRSAPGNDDHDMVLG